MTAELLNPVHYRTSLFALPTLLTASTMLALGLMVLIRERQSRVSISFFIMTATGAIWLFSYSLMYCAATAPVAATWSIIGQIGIVFIPASVYHFTVASLQTYNRHKRRVWLIWEISALFLVAVFSGDIFVSGLRLYGWGYYPIYHWMAALFVGFFFGLMGLSLHHYWTAVRTAVPGTGKLRNQGLLRAFCIAYLGSFDYLPAFGVALYPFGYAPVLGFIILVDRTIRRYRLIDITPEFAAREIVDAMDDALLLLDNDGFVRVANRSACHLFSRSETELESTSCSILARQLTTEADVLARQMLNGSLREHECLTGGASVMSISSFVMRDAGKFPIATVCMIRYITKEKAAQQQIKRHTDRQAALYELNIAATSTLELRAVLGVLLDRLAGLVPRTATTVMLFDATTHHLRRVACRGVDELAWQAEPSDGSESTHPVLQSKDALFIANIQRTSAGPDAAFFIRQGFRSYLGLPLIAKDQAVGILSFYDQEERRYGDDEINFLRSLAGQAAAAIYNSQLYEQTSRQATALQKANRVREDFLSVMSHELRTPLNVITGYAKLVQEEVMGEVNAEQRKALDKIEHHADELLFMVNSIMNATKIEVGALSVDSEEFPLAKLLDEIQLLYDYPFGKEISCEWNYPADLPFLRPDRDKLKHVLQNLINNALKFTDEGKVSVTARQIPGSAHVELTVGDTGIGIPDDELPNIFDRFRQLDSSRTHAYGGVGLGLHIVKTFTELLGGSVKATSKLGQGSTFTVTLPCIYRGSAETNLALDR
jgi:signal transduction histidine kinase/PAS domain-containing protein